MKPASSKIPFKLNLSLTSKFLIQRGFYIHEENNTELDMVKPGSVFTSSVKRSPLDIRFRLSENETEISLSYGAFVLFDTGDLTKELTRIINQLEQYKQKLV